MALEHDKKGESSPSDMDNSEWRYTDLLQTGANRWSKLSEKFWRVPSEIKDSRYAICQDCDRFIKATTQCRECACAMGIKTWLGGFACPLEKWDVAERPGKTSS